MAKERVQVQGLGGAVPGIQPTIQRAGQYSVQVQQAGRNKLMDLADALGQVNPVLQQYTRVADIEAEQFEEELAGKSPEEVQAILKKTEGELDKQVRRGGMGWLTSPLNQKRKLKAVGALMHDEYERDLKNKVQDPANSDADINELINQSKDSLRQKYGSLDSMFVNDGFEGSIRDTTQRLTLAHDAASTTQSRQDLRRAGKSVLYNASQKMEPMYNADGQLLRGEIDGNSIDEWWADNQGAFTPNELIALIEDVALTHATEGDEDSADAWLDHATKYLTVGTAALGVGEDQPLDDVFGEYGAELARMRQRVSEISESKTSKDKGDAALLKQEVDSGVTSAMLAISKGKSFEVEADTFLTTEEEVEEYFTTKLQESGNVYAMGSEGIKVIKNAINLTGEDENLIRFTQIHNQARGADVNYNALMSRSTDRVVPVTQNELTGKTSIDPSMLELALDLQIEIGQRRQEKIRELSTGEYTKVSGEQVDSTKWQDVVTVDMYDWDKEFVRQYEETLKDRISEKQTEVEAARKVEEVPSDSSYINPDTTVDDATSSFFEPHNFFDLEKNVKEGNFAEAKKIAEALSEKKYLPTSRGGFKTYQPLQEAFNNINSLTTSMVEKETARKKVLLYGIASQGSNLYNANSIKRGSINIEGTEVKIEDKEALQDLALVYPLISKTRIQEISSQQGGDVSDVLELYNALFDTTYTADEEEGKSAIKSFIEKTKSLYEK